MPSSNVLVTSDGDVITLAAELDEAKARVTEMESMETVTGRQDKERIREVK